MLESHFILSIAFLGLYNFIFKMALYLYFKLFNLEEDSNLKKHFWEQPKSYNQKHSNI